MVRLPTGFSDSLAISSSLALPTVSWSTRALVGWSGSGPACWAWAGAQAKSEVAGQGAEAYPRLSVVSFIEHAPAHSKLRQTPARWADLRRAHGVRHAVENHHALAAAARGRRLGRVGVTTVNVLPVVHHLTSPSGPWRDPFAFRKPPPT